MARRVLQSERALLQSAREITRDIFPRSFPRRCIDAARERLRPSTRSIHLSTDSTNTHTPRRGGAVVGGAESMYRDAIRHVAAMMIITIVIIVIIVIVTTTTTPASA